MALRPAASPFALVRSGGGLLVLWAGVLLGSSFARATPAEPSRLDARAAFARGLAADLGEGQPADPKLAIHYYRIAAEQGDADAELNLAVMTDSGIGVRADPALAALWYARAASHGVGRAAFDLGQLYQDGTGVARNLALASAWFGRAAREGIVAASSRALAVGRSGEAATLAAPRLVAPAADTALGQLDVEFVWEPAADTPGVTYWVQVVPLDAPGGTVAYEKSEVSSLLVSLPPEGRYAWRVFAASTALARYEASGWSGFAITRHEECCLAALTGR